MSEDVQGPPVLGKHEREEDEGHTIALENELPVGPDMAQDDSDDDIGPMPIPASAPRTVKKRKSMPTKCSALETHTDIFTVLPHEKLYLDHLPNTEQYYQSFMHRDALNFCVMTK